MTISSFVSTIGIESISASAIEADSVCSTRDASSLVSTIGIEAIVGAEVIGGVETIRSGTNASGDERLFMVVVISFACSLSAHSFGLKRNLNNDVIPFVCSSSTHSFGLNRNLLERCNA
jgi:hypothetical protein